jgi:hypothetical protein
MPEAQVVALRKQDYLRILLVSVVVTAWLSVGLFALPAGRVPSAFWVAVVLLVTAYWGWSLARQPDFRAAGVRRAAVRALKPAAVLLFVALVLEGTQAFQLGPMAAKLVVLSAFLILYCAIRLALGPDTAVAASHEPAP